MAEAEPKAIKRKVKVGDVDLHPTESAIVVNYTMEEMFMADGKPVAGDKKSLQKLIRVKTLNAATNLTALAEEIITKSKIIPASRLGVVEQQLQNLQKRQDPSLAEKNEKAAAKEKEEVKRLYQEEQRRMEEELKRSEPEEKAYISNVDQYIELLYEGISEKIRSAKMILQLARLPENMEDLIYNDALMSALSRVLLEDGKKSTELVTNIVYIFFCFSTFSQFHTFVTQSKLGDMCMKTIDHQIERTQFWMEEMEKKRKLAESNPSMLAEIEKDIKKQRATTKKQDQLLYICFLLLLNLAEDLSIEVKMVKRNIIGYLINMLERNSADLVFVVLMFLKKLSIFRENKNKMENIVPRILRFIPKEQAGVLNLSIRILTNLSHDPDIRNELIKHGCIPKALELLTSKTHLPGALGLLYQLSTDEKSRAAFAKPEYIAMIMRLILETKSSRLSRECIALAVNIASHPKGAEMMCDDGGLKFLVRRAIKTQDSSIFKLIRTLSQHEGTLRMMFLDHIDDVMHTLLKSANNDVIVELLGLLGNLVIPDFDYAKLAGTYGLLEYLERKLTPPAAVKDQPPQLSSLTDDDIVLECIILLGTLAHDEAISPMICETNIIHHVMDYIAVKQEDDEIVLQIIFACYQLLLHDPARTYLLTETHMVSYLIDLLYDKNTEIRKLCDTCLDIIAEIDDNWAVRIRGQRFQWHNGEWISAITDMDSRHALNALDDDLDGLSSSDEMEAGVVRVSSTPTATKRGGATSHGKTTPSKGGKSKSKQ